MSSSVGKKYVMAVSGLLLVGFLIAHLAGNLLIFSDKDGAAFDSYAHLLESNPLLPLAELALGLLFVVHIAMALRVSFQNRDARSQGYAVRADLGRRTIASGSMLITGLLVLVFLLIHLYDFRIGKLLDDPPPSSLAAFVKERLATPVGAAIYLAGVAALALHLRHAFRSAFQSLGANHPHLNPALEKVGIALAILLGLGFAAFPIVFLVAGAGS
ncbi:MAG: succinate dehydrogenase cytochrome b subunit [Planctomycetota bacterium]